MSGFAEVVRTGLEALKTTNPWVMCVVVAFSPSLLLHLKESRHSFPKGF